MTLVLDRGGLIAIERGDRAMWRRLKGALLSQSVPVTHAGVLGQVWRGGGRQARLSLALECIDVRPLDQVLGRRSGELLAATRTADVVDAALALITEDGDEIFTSDPDDIGVLVAEAGRHVEIVRV